MANKKKPAARKSANSIRDYLPSWKAVLGLLFFGGLIGIVGLAWLVNRTPIPSPNEIATANSTVVYYADGKKTIGNIGEFNRVTVNLAQVPITMQHAVLAAEDREFYNHSGFSITGIARAVLNNITTGSAQGGSTITQQYVKNAYLTSERSIVRKLKELVLSIKLETSDSKDEILSNYLNTAYLGRGAYGVQAAARAYFNKDVGQLDVAQAAMIASLLKSPEGFAPEVDLPRLQERWNWVLDQMVAADWLTQSERDATVFPEIREKTVNRLGGTKGYILAAVKAKLIEMGYDESTLGVAGLKVVTTIDKQSQQSAVKAVEKEGPTTGTEGLRIGLAAVRPGTGEIVAMYGGADYVEQPLNNATQAIAQAGSTFKPFALYTALSQGVTLDEPLPGKNGTVVSGYKVHNYGGESFGEVTLLQATEESINTAYVQLAYNIGIDAIITNAQAAGIPADTPGIERNLTFVLGTSSPHVLDVANAYATFAAEGLHADPYLITSITSHEGSVMYEASQNLAQVFDANVVRTLSYALQKVVTAGTGRAAQDLGRPVAGKTGTTDENKSAWFAGYTPNLAAAVMLVKQDANGNPISLAGTGGMTTVYGGSFPARIFTRFMKGALKDVAVVKFNKPTATPSVTETPTSGGTESGTPTDSSSPTDTNSATATDTASATATP